jgi:hypothetical protein
MGFMFQLSFKIAVCQCAGEIKSPKVRVVRGLHIYHQIFSGFYTGRSKGGGSPPLDPRRILRLWSGHFVKPLATRHGIAHRFHRAVTGDGGQKRPISGGQTVPV